MKFATGKPLTRVAILSLILVAVCNATVAQRQTREVGIEVFTVAGFPLNVQQAVLVKTDHGYLVRCQLGNNSDSEMTGLRYSVALGYGQTRHVVNLSEGVKLKPYETRKITFQTPLRMNIPKSGERVVMMLEQAVSTDSIWEVAKAKDALDAYLRGDYSVVPTVIRVANQVDAPIPKRIIY